MEILAITIVLLGFALLAMSIKFIFNRKAGTAKSSCQPYTDETGMGCACGGMCTNEGSREK